MVGCEEVAVWKALEELWARFGVMWFDRAEKGLAAGVPYAVIGTSVEEHGFFVNIFLHILHVGYTINHPVILLEYYMKSDVIRIMLSSVQLRWP